MDLIKNIVYEDTYCENIKMDKYTQTSIVKNDNIIECMTSNKSLEELLLHTYDYVSLLKKMIKIMLNHES